MSERKASTPSQTVGPFLAIGMPWEDGPVADRDGVRISGQVFEVPDKDVLASLDDYEAFDPEDRAGNLFVRVKRPVTLADGRQVECWIYVFDGDPGGAPIVAGGDYARSRPRTSTPPARW